ncbi:sugar O-acetyltransferase [Arenibacterium sp. CAU 1754]
MTRSAREKMMAGDWYCCLDPELLEIQMRAREAVHEHNSLPPRARGGAGPKLRATFAAMAEDALIEAPFHCAYGINISVGAGVYMNAGCTILDTAPVTIGRKTMFGPAVQIYCADHHRDPALRTQGLERARPVTIGSQVWIGGGAILLPGVTVGDNAIIGAGSVVTHDVAAGATVVGNPARAVKP